MVESVPKNQHELKFDIYIGRKAPTTPPSATVEKQLHNTTVATYEPHVASTGNRGGRGGISSTTSVEAQPTYNVHKIM